MDNVRLAELKQRAQTATKLADTLRALKDAPAMDTRRAKWKDWNTANDVLPEDLLAQVIKLGLRELTSQIEAKLESLLGHPAAADKITLTVPPDAQASPG